MIFIDSPYLQETIGTYSAAIVAQVMLADNNYAPLTVIDYGGIASAIIVNPADLPDDWQQITSVIANGVILSPAENPESPQIGEFIYNPYANTVEPFTKEPVQSLLITGTPKIISMIPPLLPPPYPALFTSLPIEGSIQISRSFENQPSAQFEFETTLSKGQLQSLFAPGLELDLYGIALRINNISITELPRSIYPNSRCKVSVSLGSKWENYLNEPVFLRSDGANPITFNQFECQPSGTTSDQNRSTTIQALLTKLGISYIGPTLAPIDIPRDTPRDATANPVQLLQDRVRLANCFLRWSNAGGIEAIPINNLPTWSYNEWDIIGEIETNYEAIARPSKKPFTAPYLNPLPPNLTSFPSTIQSAPTPTLGYEYPTALAFEYPNVELTGDFQDNPSQQEEATQGNSKPRFVRKPTKRETRIEGDSNAYNPPEDVDTIQAMSLCFDLGGPTKNRIYVTEEDGAVVEQINEIWGFFFIADQIYDENKEKLSGNPDNYWGCIRRTTASHVYNENTGYLLNIYENGYNTVRYRQESSESPETLQFSPDDEDYSLYKFFQIPVLSQTSNLLRLMPEYSIQDGLEWITICNRDGTSSLEAVINPDYAPPYYTEAERTESSAFARRSNPDDETLDLIVGEESRFESSLQISEAVYEEKLIGFEEGYPVYKRGQEISPARYSKYIKQFKAQGQQIAEALEQTSVENGTGSPPQASRRPPRYTREDPAPKDKIEREKEKYRYFLRTEGYNQSDPTNGTESFPLAKNFEEAFQAAKCKAAIENWRNGLQEKISISGNLNIKEGDRFNYFCNGESRQRVVLSVSHVFNILGVVDNIPKITLLTQLTLGRWILPSVDYSKVLVPVQDLNGTITFALNQTLGSILSHIRSPSRRNPK